MRQQRERLQQLQQKLGGLVEKRGRLLRRISKLVDELTLTQNDNVELRMMVRKLKVELEETREKLAAVIESHHSSATVAKFPSTDETVTEECSSQVPAEELRIEIEEEEIQDYSEEGDDLSPITIHCGPPPAGR
jgi:septal ring factor EnvC (AmiA/AmiB activator)